jgi:Protein of unknown function (DUF3987)
MKAAEKLRVDRGELQRFVETVFCHADEGTFVSMRAFRDDSDGTWRPADWPSIKVNGDFNVIVDAAASFASQCAAADVAVVFAPPLSTFANAEKADREALANGLTVSVELDQHPSESRLTLEKILGPTTIVVASGGVWTDHETGEIQDKLHCHWRLSAPTRTQIEHDFLRECRNLATRLGGGDPTSIPAVHPLRWPGSWHRKAEPKLCHIVAHNPEVEITLVDALNKLRKAVEEAPVRLNGPDSPKLGPVNETELENDIITGKSYHAACTRLVGRWAQRCVPFLDAQKKLFELFDRVAPQLRDNRWRARRKDVPKIIRDIYGAEAQQRDAREARQENDLAELDARSPPPGTASENARVVADDDSWEPWPEPANILAEFPMPPFPVDFLPGDLGEFVAGQAHRIQVPVDYIAIPALIAAATVIGKDFRMAPKANDSWSERACLWGGIIGYVGDGKTPGFKVALGPIWSLQAEFREQHKKDLEAHKPKTRAAKIFAKAWEKAANKAVAAGKEVPPEPAGIEVPDPPCVREIICNDTTQERLVDMMSQNPRGIMLYRDELSGWFASFNQYRPGSDEQFYLQCHAGGPWKHQRKSGDIFVEDLFLNICGGFQPEIAGDVLRRGRTGGHGRAVESGLAARLSLLVWPDAIVRDWVDEPSNRDQKARIDRLFHDLLNFTPEGFVGKPIGGAPHSPPFRFTEEAQEIFRDWYITHNHELAARERGEPLQAHFAKYDGLFACLSLVRHLICWALGLPVELSRIDAETANAVRSFIDDYLRPHAKKIYGHIDRDSAYQGARRIAKWIAAETDVTHFTARDISRKQWSGLTGKDEITGKDHLGAALRYLEDVAGWLRSEERPTGPKGGRPTIRFVINPLVRQNAKNPEKVGFVSNVSPFRDVGKK